MLWVAAMYVVATEHGRCGLYTEAMQCMSSAGSVMLECKLYCELLLLLNMVVFYVEGCGVNSTECMVNLAGVNRLMCM